MDLVVDANIIISALVTPQSKSIDILFMDGLRFYSPEFLLEEFKEHKKEIMDKSTLTEEEFHLAFSLVFSRIRLIPFSEFSYFISKSKEVCPDEDDVEYFALALKLNCALWSNDKDLKQQSVVMVFSTTDLLNKLRM